MKSYRCLFVGLALVFASACGKSAAEKFADSYCAEIAKCCGQAGRPANGKVCHQLMVLEEAYGSYDSKAGDACLATMRTEVSAGTFCTNLATSTSCDSVFGSSSSGGNKKVGETCDFDNDCALSNEGKTICDFESKKCVALLEVGATCGTTFDCVSSAFCDYDSDKCTARIAAGGVCTGGNSAECVDGYYCSSNPRQCTAKLANGATCTSFTQCQSNSCSDGTCQDNGSGDFGMAILCGE
jgi:hypothetical protein